MLSMSYTEEIVFSATNCNSCSSWVAEWSLPLTPAPHPAWWGLLYFRTCGSVNLHRNIWDLWLTNLHFSVILICNKKLLSCTNLQPGITYLCAINIPLLTSPRQVEHILLPTCNTRVMTWPYRRALERFTWESMILVLVLLEGYLS